MLGVDKFFDDGPGFEDPFLQLVEVEVIVVATVTEVLELPL